MVINFGEFTLLSFKTEINAFRSFGRHEPPNPGPACKNKEPILGSIPITFATSSTLAPGIVWQRLEIEFIKLIFVAKNALLEFSNKFGVEKSSLQYLDLYNQILY